MSLVGTRPPTVDEWDKYELHHRARLATKPGLTGMWQVSGRSNITDLPAGCHCRHDSFGKTAEKDFCDYTCGVRRDRIRRSIVVLPSPEGPTRATIS